MYSKEDRPSLAPLHRNYIFSARMDWEARMLLEKPTSNAVGAWGGYACAAREQISVNDELKIAAIRGVHDVLEHLTLQYAFQHQASRTWVEGGPV
jgi:hypothetical protein